jgi:dihydrofolate synthase/folylpolyglutamate synthase
MIPESEVINFVTRHKVIISTVKPSFFEMTVAMAFNFFAESNVDVAVIEVGLGGRLDSTNIITPILSVITNIGHDHMDLLGNTFEKIALEKAGIIKKNIPALISETQSEIKDVFIRKAKENHSPVFFADEIFSCELGKNNSQTGQREYLIKRLSGDELIRGETPLGGDCQAKNLKAVFASFTILKNSYAVSGTDIIEGIKKVVINTGLLGRWQTLGTSPLTICDTGHNKEGLEYVMRQLRHIKKSALHIVVGFVNDKDLGLVLPLFPADASYYFTKASVPRALSELILKNEAAKFGLKGESYSSVKEALNNAKKNANPDDVIFVGGSTFIVAEVV